MLYHHLSMTARVLAAASLVTLIGGTTPAAKPPAPGMTFRLRVSLRHAPSSGKSARALTLFGHGAFAGGHGRVDVDSTDAPSPFRKGDFIIIVDTINSMWARPSDLRVRRMNAPLVNPLEGISERLSGVAGLPSDLAVDFDTVALNETLNGRQVNHYRITANATYPVGSRDVHQKVVVEQWLATIPITVTNPFGSRIRGLPDIPTKNSAYRAFISTLAAANRVFGEAVAVKTVTTTSYNYGGGMGEDYFQTVELLDIKQGDVDARLFSLPDEFRKKPPAPR